MEVNLEKNKIKDVWLIIGTIFIAFITSLAIIHFPPINITNLTILVFVITVGCQFIIPKINRTYDIFHPLALFIIFYSYMMVSSYLVETYFSFNIDSLVLSKNFDNTVYYCFLCFISFVLTSLITSFFLFRKKKITTKLEEFKKIFPYKRVIQISKAIVCFFLILLYAMLIIYWNKFVGVKYGYGARTIENTIIFIFYTWSYISILFYGVISTTYYKKVFTPSVSIFLSALFFYGFILGSRSLMMTIVLAIIFLFTLKSNLLQVKKIFITKKILTMVITIVLLGLVIIFGSLFRGGKTQNIPDQVKAFKHNIQTPLIKAEIIHHILSIFPNYFITSNVMEITPKKEPYQNGATFVNGIYQLIPRIITQNYSSNMSNWFKNHYSPNTPGGFGFSIEAEGYVNFGYFGFIVFIFWGYLLTYFYYKYVNNLYIPWYSYLYLIFLLASIFGIRAEFSQIIKIVFYSYLYTLMIRFYLQYNLIRKSIPKDES